MTHPFVSVVTNARGQLNKNASMASMALLGGALGAGAGAYQGISTKPHGFKDIIKAIQAANPEGSLDPRTATVPDDVKTKILDNANHIQRKLIYGTGIGTVSGAALGGIMDWLRANRAARKAQG